MKKNSKAKKSVKTLSAKKAAGRKASNVRGGGLATTLTNIANMKHEALKGIAQNLRG